MWPIRQEKSRYELIRNKKTEGTISDKNPQNLQQKHQEISSN